MASRAPMIQAEGATGRRNILLDSLSDGDSRALAPCLTYVDLCAGRCLATLATDEPIVCFPLSLVTSVVQLMADGSRFEIGLIGSEGMIGWSAVAGAVPAPLAGIAQLGGGAALVAPAAIVAEHCRQSVTLHAAMLAFVQSFAAQMSHTIVANLRYGIERRLARRLLMLHDRIDGDVLTLTHGELATALHVRRASITDTLHILEGDHVLRCTRGQLAIRDRPALMRIAGDSYGPAEASYRALIGDFGKG